MSSAWRTQLLAASCAAAAALVSVALLDERVARAMSGQAPWQRAASRVAEAGDSLYWFVLLVAGFLGFHLARRHDAARWCFLAIVSLAASGLAAGALKITLLRWRPSAFIAGGSFDGPLGWGFPGVAIEHARNSFPSGHATTALSLAALATMRWPRLALVWVIIGACVAGARVVQNSHWLGDMLAGSAIGWAVPWCAMAVWTARWPRSAPRQRSVTTA